MQCRDGWREAGEQPDIWKAAARKDDYSCAAGPPKMNDEELPGLRRSDRRFPEPVWPTLLQDLKFWGLLATPLSTHVTWPVGPLIHFSAGVSTLERAKSPQPISKMMRRRFSDQNWYRTSSGYGASLEIRPKLLVLPGSPSMGVDHGRASFMSCPAWGRHTACGCAVSTAGREAASLQTSHDWKAIRVAPRLMYVDTLQGAALPCSSYD